MDDISKILNRTKFIEPDIIRELKMFIQEKYKEEVQIKLNKDLIIISSSSAGLINSLRLDSIELVSQLKIDKKIIFKIS